MAAAAASAEGPGGVRRDACALTRRGYSVLKAALPGGEAAVEVLRQELTVTPRTMMNGPGSSQASSASASEQQQQASFPVYLESGSKLYVPRFFGLQRFGPPGRDALPPGELLPPAVRFEGSVRPEQRPAIDAYLAAARDPTRMGGILSLPCGSGKTVIALHLLAALGRRALIVVHKDFLLQQWRERIAEFLPAASVGVVKAQKTDVAGRDVVIASLQSLAMKEYPEGTLDGFGLLIVDEVHRVGSAVYSRALHKTAFRHTLGLSATVTRKDGCTKVFVWHLGDVLHRARRRKDEVAVAQLRYFSPDPRYCAEPLIFGGKLNMSRMLNNVCAWAPRTALVAAAAREALAREPGRKVLVLSDRKEQLSALKAALEGGGPLPDGRPPPTAGFYVGGMKPAALAQSERCDVILATYAFASEGFDAQGLDTLVLASPKTDIEQSVGRILRKRAEDRERTPLILDIVDDFSLFARQALKRRAYFRKHGYRMLASLEHAWAECGGDDEEEEGGSGEEEEADSSSGGGRRPVPAFAFVEDA